MPIYEYVCSNCHHQWEDYSYQYSAADTQICSMCGQNGNRVFSLPNVEKENLRYSLAMAVHPSQIEEATKRWPGSEYNKKGHLKIHNRTEKLQRAKERGLHETE